LVISNIVDKLDVERQKVWVFLKRGEFLSKKLVPLYLQNTTKENLMKTYLVQQSVDVAVCYQIEANSLDEAMDMVDNGQYGRKDIVDVSVCDWDRPWDVAEAEGSVPSMTEEQLKPYDVLGL
jgi:hypothetical protein